MIVGIDPGVKACGVGVLDAVGQLKGARLVRGLAPGDLAIGVLDFVRELRRSGAEMHERLRVVIEYPQAYAPGQQKGDQNDLIRLTLVAGACGGAIRAAFDHATLATLEFILPRTWKGTIDPDVYTSRIEGRLSPLEVARIESCPANLRHNTLDGVGLALFSAGRLERRRTYD